MSDDKPTAETCPHESWQEFGGGSRKCEDYAEWLDTLPALVDAAEAALTQAEEALGRIKLEHAAVLAERDLKHEEVMALVTRHAARAGELEVESRSLQSQRDVAVRHLEAAQATAARRDAALQRILALSTPSLVVSTYEDLKEIARIAMEALDADK